MYTEPNQSIESEVPVIEVILADRSGSELAKLAANLELAVSRQSQEANSSGAKQDPRVSEAIDLARELLAKSDAVIRSKS